MYASLLGRKGWNKGPGNRGTLNEDRGNINEGREISNEGRGTLNVGPGNLKRVPESFFGVRCFAFMC